MPEGTVPGGQKLRLAGLAAIWAAGAWTVEPGGPAWVAGAGAAACALLARRPEAAALAAALGCGWAAAEWGWMAGLAALVVTGALAARGLRRQALAAGLLFAFAAALMGPAGGGGQMRAWLLSLGWAPEVADAALFAFRKGVHVVGYAALAAAAAWAIGPEAKRRWAAAACFALGTAIADEWIQSSSLTRTGQASDVAIDSVGIALGLAAFSWRVKRNAGLL